VRGNRILLGVAGVALCAWCGWVSAYHRTSGQAEITWVISLSAVIAVDLALWRGTKGERFGWHLRRVDNPWPRPGRGGGRLALQGVAPWVVLCAVVLTWDLLGIDTGPHEYHLTISALAQAYRPLNAALLLVWMLAGVGYEAARARAPAAAVLTGPVHPDPDLPDPGALLCAGVVTFGGHPIGGLLLPQSPPIGIAFWVAVPIVGLLVDLTARRSGGRLADAEEFVRFISTPRTAKVALIAAWAFAGYHLFAR
jgi:hypothetical protein